MLSETTGKSNTDFSIQALSNLSHVENIIDSYTIQILEEERRKNERLKLQYYFDTFDVVNMIRGGLEYANFSGGFNKVKFENEELKNLVYAFAYQGIYKDITTIRMLAPHKLEFSLKSSSVNSGIGGLDKQKAEALIAEVLSYFSDNMSEIIELLELGNDNNRKRLIRKLVRNTPDLFIINFLLQQNISWHRRLKYLTKEEVLTFDKLEDEIVSIEDAKLFRLISEGFRKVRHANVDNNLYDSLAFYHLQKLLENYIEDDSNPLPVFLASTPTVIKAVQKIRDVNPDLFSYPFDKNDPNSKRIPIVRDFLFFALEPIFTTNKNVKDLFDNLDESRPLIRNLLQEEYIKTISTSYEESLQDNLKRVIKRFENNISILIKTKFTEQVWLKKKVYNQLITELAEECKALTNWTKKQGKELEISIANELDSILDDTKIDLQNARRLTTIIKSFRGVNKDVEDILQQDNIRGKLDVFRDFALMKFGVDSRLFPDFQKFIDNLLVNDTLDYHSTDLLGLLSKLSVNVQDSTKAKNFLEGIVTAWILGKNSLIVDLCSPYDKSFFRDHYSTALIYAAAIVEVDLSKKGEDRVNEVIKCILSKKDNNYKVWIGVAYLYNRLWEIKNEMYGKVPEMDKKAWSGISKNAFHTAYFKNGTYKYILKAYKYLKEKLEIERDSPHFQIYLSYYLYVLNNLIYYTSKGGTKAQFNKLHIYVNEFLKYEGVESVWQGRFYDTLGWYSLRNYYFIDSKYKDVYRDKVDKYLKQARKRIATYRDYRLYDLLQDAVITV